MHAIARRPQAAAVGGDIWYRGAGLAQAIIGERRIIQDGRGVVNGARPRNGGEQHDSYRHKQSYQETWNRKVGLHIALAGLVFDFILAR